MARSIGQRAPAASEGTGVTRKVVGRDASARSPRADGEANSPSERVFNEILDGIYEGRYVPGQRLIEADLIVTYGVGRGSVREALKKLEVEGVVVLTFHKGAYVRTLSRNDVRDILQVMESMVGLAARLAAEQCDTAGARLMRDNLAALMAHKNRPEEFAGFVRARNAYYRVMATVGGNNELIRILPSMHVYLMRTQVSPRYVIMTQNDLYNDYQKMTAAIVANDGSQAERAARAHVRRIQRGMDRLPDYVFAAGE